MLYEVEWAEDGTYRPGEYNSPEKFFNDCLENSKEFDLQLGYFSSATISVLADGFASFIANGGRMRLVINHIVSDEDKEAISKGVHGGVIDCFDLTNFEELRKTFDEYQQQFFECLAFLIYNKRIDIRIIKPRNKKGIAHTKTGQFRDGDSITSFTGSANFTINGLFNNLENITIFRSDSLDRMVQKNIASQREEFDSIMYGKKRNIEYLSPENLVSAIQSTFGDKDIEELLDVEKKLRKIKEEKAIRERQERIDIVCEDYEETEPRFPFPSGPREYQQIALNKWKENKLKGLFAMATGTGKTITALNCLLEIYKRKGYYKAIILVPTITLVEQWEKECRKFNFKHIIKVSSQNRDWKDTISQLTIRERNRVWSKDCLYIIIATYASFAKSQTFDYLNGLPEGKVLLIADEAHNMGANLIKKRLDEIKYQRRIGLSATPDRQYDDAGNHAINRFFGVEDEYTFVYDMREAIQNKVLCQYEYYPHLVELTDSEMECYVEISEEIAKYISVNEDAFNSGDPILTGLLLKRKRIIHKAANKKIVFKSILEQRFKEKGNLKYTLVYVPEGDEPESTADVFDERDMLQTDSFTDKLIDQYSTIVKNINERVTIRKFTAQTTDRDQVIRDFADGRIDVLTSMKCLDEGIDVPRSELAIFCASTGNPRQFIQRRGRILRTHPDKHLAVIHDLVVAPRVDPYSPSFELEKRLLAGELKRVKNFVQLSENSIDSVDELDEVMAHYGLSLFS